MGKWANTDGIGPSEGFCAVKCLRAMLLSRTGDIIRAIVTKSNIFSQEGHRGISAMRMMIRIRMPHLHFPSFLSVADEIKKYKDL